VTNWYNLVADDDDGCWWRVDEKRYLNCGSQNVNSSLEDGIRYLQLHISPEPQSADFEISYLGRRSNISPANIFGARPSPSSLPTLLMINIPSP
jgi:CubicO group peptidase (beta-lactamase class C family)